MNLPEEYDIKDDYGSHAPALYFVRCMAPQFHFVEFGCGNYSTPFLSEYDYSFENNKEWAAKFPTTYAVEDYYGLEGNLPNAILFIDSAPGEERKYLLAHYANDAEIIIVHDTQKNTNVYWIEPVLQQFKYRCDFYPEGWAGTSIVSNKFDVSSWRGAEIGPYKIS